MDSIEATLPSWKPGQHRDDWYRNVCAKSHARVLSGRWEKRFAAQVIDLSQIRVNNHYANELEATAVTQLDFAYVRLLRS